MFFFFFNFWGPPIPAIIPPPDTDYSEANLKSSPPPKFAFRKCRLTIKNSDNAMRHCRSFLWKKFNF